MYRTVMCCLCPHERFRFRHRSEAKTDFYYLQNPVHVQSSSSPFRASPELRELARFVDSPRPMSRLIAHGRCGAMLLLLLLLLLRPLDGLHHPPPHARGHQPARRGGGRWGAAGQGGGGAGREDWAEERQVARVLEEKIIRKVSMKRWLEERHRFYPTLSAVERLKVEEGEEMRDRVFALEGWRPSRKMAQFQRPQRTRWEQTAKESCRDSTPESRAVSASWPMVDLTSEPLPGASRLRGMSQLRGGGGGSGAGVAQEHRERWWRKMIDSVWQVEFEKDGKVMSLSLSGLFFDCFLADQLLFLVQMSVDMVVAVPVLKLVTKILFPPLLPSLSEYPQVAGLSIMIAHWGMRLSKTVPKPHPPPHLPPKP